ncbi:LOW QUALITY PROTEIN: hypothetical protein HID58_018913 [Brassica napus]|uniref:Uncharacterized protein n=1 Tax=Brassica napus TaxID=3708 RepID=A0ABQ8DBC6_BRANA|nr:LOW QUALITY PROTEIN: hypothetical protein HID58_018913 [Brassica napus]
MLYLSLWDGAATSFWGNLCSGYTTHSVMVVITVNPKIFGGIGGTEEVLPRVEIFTVPLQSPTTRILQLMVIYFSPLRPIRLIFYVRLGSSVSSSKMVGRHKRSSVACTGCSRRLDKSKTSLQCNRCVSPNVTGVQNNHTHSKVEQSKSINKRHHFTHFYQPLDDGYENAVFVVSDTEMTKQTKKDAATMALEEVASSSKAPQVYD